MDDTTVTGVLLYILAVSAALTVPVSFFLLRLYRRAVLKGMNVAAGIKDTAPPSVTPPPPSHALRIANTGRSLRPLTGEGKSWLDGAVTLSLRRVALAYVAAGLAFAAVFAVAWSAQAGGGFLPIRFLLLTVDFSWPVVLALSQLVALGWRHRLRFTALYLVLFMVATAAGLLISDVLDPLGLIGLWLMLNGLGTLLLLAFSPEGFAPWVPWCWHS